MKFVPIAIKFSVLIALIVVIVLTIFGTFSIIFSTGKQEEEINDKGSQVAILIGGRLEKEPILFVKPKDDSPEKWKWHRHQERERWSTTLEGYKKQFNVVNIAIRDIQPDEKLEPVGVHRPGSFDFISTKKQLGKDVTIEDGFYSVKEVQNAKWDVRRFSKQVNIDGKSLASLDVYVSLDTIHDVQINFIKTLIFIGLASIFGGTIVAIVMGVRLTNPIKQLSEDMRIIQSGELTHESSVKSNDELGVLASAFNQMVGGLRDAERLKETAARVEHELQLAKEIQFSLLPVHVPSIPGVDISAIYIPAKEIGGDYYDIIDLKEGKFSIAIGDVSGKGIPAALLMTMIRGMTHMAPLVYSSSSDFVSGLNKILSRDVKRGSFVTFQHITADVPNGKLTICSAGHMPVLVTRADQCIEVTTNGIALGVVNDQEFAKIIEEKTFRINSGTRILCYTDGVNEAMNEVGELYGRNRLIDFMKKNSQLPSEQFIQKLVDDIAVFRGSAEQSDDITIATLLYHGPA